VTAINNVIATSTRGHIYKENGDSSSCGAIIFNSDERSNATTSCDDVSAINNATATSTESYIYKKNNDSSSCGTFILNVCIIINIYIYIYMYTG